jgi:hypothetical protein
MAYYLSSEMPEVEMQHPEVEAQHPEVEAQRRKCIIRT